MRTFIATTLCAATMAISLRQTEEAFPSGIPCMAKPTVQQTNFVFNKIDDNNDGKVDCPEMKQAGKDIMKALTSHDISVPATIQKVVSEHVGGFMQAHNCSIDAMQANQGINAGMMMINKANPACKNEEWGTFDVAKAVMKEFGKQ